MRLRIQELLLPIEHSEQQLKIAILQRLKIAENQLTEFIPIRRSIDARQRHTQPLFVYTIEVSVTADLDCKKLKKVVAITEQPNPKTATLPKAKFQHRPIVVGAGPAGLMATLELTEAGANPILIERGSATEQRTKEVKNFWQNGELNQDNNTLFGEGGAGLFSDGKLTARTKDRVRMQKFFATLVRCGAPKSIMLDAEPHLGSDCLQEIVPKLRQLIINAGGEVRYNSKLEDFIIENNRLQAIIVDGQKIQTDTCILAVGHSARDIYSKLLEHKIAIEAKPFAVGVRLEIPQASVDKAQYGRFAGHKNLGSASFRLVNKANKKSRSVYSFCMCPGGLVIACASQQGMLTTNGMSLANRNLPFANAAFLVPVQEQDFLHDTTKKQLSGIQFQQQIEQQAFQTAGNDYTLPAQRLSDFIKGKVSKTLPDKRSCKRAISVDLQQILPTYVSESLRHSIPIMLRKMRGVSLDSALLYGPETRSSSPVRIIRSEKCSSINTQGIFPCGEGAGYAGGIVSSAIDGLRVAQAVINSN